MNTTARALGTVAEPLAVRRSLPVYALFVASGAAALVYQVIWQRWLALVFGNTTVSVAIVLASFMIGLALGSALVARVLHRIAQPMRVYALAELGIGAFALAFPLLGTLVEQVYAGLVGAETPASLSLPLRAVLAMTLLALPTTLMGTTLPLLSEHFERSPAYSRSWKAGLLYGANTLGAALGVLLCGFVLLELLGVRSSALLAAGLNFAVAGLALRLARAPLARADAAGAAAPVRDFDGRFALAALTLSGAAALASEVLWTRALEVLLGNSTYAFSMIVLAWLVGIALGSAALSRAPHRLRNPPLLLCALLGAMALGTLADIALIERLHAAIAGLYGKPVSAADLLWQYARASAMFVPLALLSGAMFPVATRLLERPGQPQASGWRIARASAWNTLGCVAGSLAAGFAIAPRFDFFEALYLLAGAYAAGAALLLGALALREPRNARSLAAVAPLVLLAVALASFALWRSAAPSTFIDRLHLRHPELEASFHRPGVQGITTVLTNPHDGSQLLLVNGAGMTRKGRDLQVMAHLPLLLHPDPRSTLVICFGMGTTYRSAVAHGQHVTVVELVDEVYEAFPHFYADADAVRAYPKGRMLVNDGRNFLLLTHERFDVITLDPPPPINGAGVNNLYSRDFIELARSRLNQGGILAHWIPYPRTGAGVDSVQMLAMLVRTFASVFPDALMMPSLESGGFHIIGSDRPILPRLERLREALEIPAVRAELEEFPPDFTRRLIPWNSTVYHFPGGLRFDPAAPVPLVTDDRPRLEFSLLDDWIDGRDRYYPQLVW